MLMVQYEYEPKTVQDTCDKLIDIFRVHTQCARRVPTQQGLGRLVSSDLPSGDLALVGQGVVDTASVPPCAEPSSDIEGLFPSPA